MNRPVRVFLVDDQVLMRQGLRTLLDLDEEAWTLVRRAMPRGAGIREWNWAVLDLAASICLPAPSSFP